MMNCSHKAMPMMKLSQAIPDDLRLSSPSQTLGTMWTEEINNFRESGSCYEASICLRRIEELLSIIGYEDRIKYCKPDIEKSQIVICRTKSFWNSNLDLLALRLYSLYFDENPFRKLSVDLIHEIFLWLAVDDFTPVLSVSRNWNALGSHDKIWKIYYNRRFLRQNPLHPFDVLSSFRSIKDGFKARFEDPHVGDKVEVAWRGKFRLEASDVYQGLAWWIAEIVDKHTVQGKYKISYPGWDERWDEWVPRHRLRWAVEKNTVVQIFPHDSVEIWCCGATVPGAWLDSRVTQVRDGQFCVGNVLSTGDLWVSRERLRVVKHARNYDENGEPNRAGNRSDDIGGENNASITLLGRTLTLSSRLSFGGRSPISSPRMSLGRTSEQRSCNIM